MGHNSLSSFKFLPTVSNFMSSNFSTMSGFVKSTSKTFIPRFNRFSFVHQFEHWSQISGHDFNVQFCIVGICKRLADIELYLLKSCLLTIEPFDNDWLHAVSSLVHSQSLTLWCVDIIQSCSANSQVLSTYFRHQRSGVWPMWPVWWFNESVPLPFIPP